MNKKYLDILLINKDMPTRLKEEVNYLQIHSIEQIRLVNGLLELIDYYGRITVFNRQETQCILQESSELIQSMLGYSIDNLTD